MGAVLIPEKPIYRQRNGEDEYISIFQKIPLTKHHNYFLKMVIKTIGL